MMHKIDLPNNGVAYVSDKINDEINQELLKWLKNYQEPKIKIYKRKK